MKNRNPLLSFVLSLLITGLGQVYNGQLKRGIFLLLLIIPIHLLLGFIGVKSFYGFVFILFALLLYKLYVSFDAYIKSKKINPYELKSVNKLWIYVLFGIFSYAVMWYSPILNRSIIGYQAHSIPTPSMEPTIKAGDHNGNQNKTGKCRAWRYNYIYKRRRSQLSRQSNGAFKSRVRNR